LVEQGTLESQAGNEGVFRIKIITEGKGSSGVYSADLLEQYGEVFANRAMHMNHPRDPERPWERDILGIAARTSEVEVGTDEQGRRALYTNAKVRKEYRDFVAEYADLIGVSIYASGEGREENGEYVVESFDGSDPYTSVDFVVAAGRGGRVERMLESYRQIETSVGTPTVEGAATASTEDKKMGNEMDELKALIEALRAEVKTLTEEVTSIKTLSEQAATEATAKADAFEVVEELTTAVAEAKLPEEGRKRVIESVKAGNAVAEAVAVEKAYVESIRKSLSEGQKPAAEPVAGRVVEAAGAADFDWDYKKVIG
jgi:hypothetical protein